MQYTIFQGIFKRENGPLRHSVKQHIKVGKRPTKEEKHPIKVHGLFSGTPAMVENGPSNKAHYGPYPQYGWDFPEEIPEKFRKDPGNALRAFPGISLESTAGMPQTL